MALAGLDELRCGPKHGPVTANISHFAYERQRRKKKTLIPALSRREKVKRQRRKKKTLIPAFSQREKVKRLGRSEIEHDAPLPIWFGMRHDGCLL